MKTIKELLNKQNRLTTIKLIVYPLFWYSIMWATIYSIAWLDYNIFYQLKMRDSNKYTIDQIKSWAWNNKIFITPEIIDKTQPNPPDLRIDVRYWGFRTKGKIVYKQNKKEKYEMSNKMNQLYRHYYETYLENQNEIKIQFVWFNCD